MIGARPILLVEDNDADVDGIDVLREMRAHAVYRTVPVVVLTTSDEDRDIKRSYDIGATSYTVKPVAFMDMVERIELYWFVTNVPYPHDRAAG